MKPGDVFYFSYDDEKFALNMYYSPEQDYHRSHTIDHNTILFYLSSRHAIWHEFLLPDCTTGWTQQLYHLKEIVV